MMSVGRVRHVKELGDLRVGLESKLSSDKLFYKNTSHSYVVRHVCFIQSQCLSTSI